MLNEVLVYNIVDDLWVLFLGKVYNLIFLCEKYKGKNFICIFFQRFSICMLCQLSFIDILQVVVDIIFEEFMYFFSVFL